MFHSQLAKELSEFELADVVQAIADKLEFRHPHVFSDAKVKDAAEVLGNWERIKAVEKKQKTGREGSVLDGVPRDAPALMRAERLTDKASRIGFDWKQLSDVRAKVDEELAELDEAIASGDRDAIEGELGDVLFALCNVGRWVKAPPEDALRGTIDRFTDRFHFIEATLVARGVKPGEASLEELDALWDEAKARAKAGALKA